MKVKLIFILCFTIINVSAQQGKEVKTVFGSGKPQLGYFINPSCQLGKFAGSTAVIPGLGAGVVFNNKVSCGIVYKLTVTENTPPGEVDQLYLHGQWAGLRCEYTLKPESVVHLSFPVEIGAGEIELDLKDSYENQPIAIPPGDCWFANIEPGVAIEINLHKYLKFNISAGYRFVSDVSFRSLTEKDLMGFTSTASFKIGFF
jgi:hypothetical protein